MFYEGRNIARERCVVRRGNNLVFNPIFVVGVKRRVPTNTEAVHAQGRIVLHGYSYISNHKIQTSSHAEPPHEM